MNKVSLDKVVVSLDGALKVLICSIASIGALGFFSTPANAIPLFARQTGQNCVACHAGGQYPELTPYGRYFKLTGYTIGARQDLPISVQFVGGSTTSTSGNLGPSQSQQSGRLEADNASVFVGGKIFDNFGAFSQWTYQWANNPNPNNPAGPNNQGHFAADNQDWRYADHFIGDQKSMVNDIIWGASLNNKPGVTDVWNSSPAWNYPYMGSIRNASTNGVPFNAVLGSLQAPGYGGYVYLNKNIYAELMGYQSGGSGPLSFLTYGSSNSNPNATPTYLKGINPYLRLAYQSDEHGSHNWMVGAMAMNTNMYQNCGTDPSCVTPGSPLLSGGSTMYQDRGVDAQYQYLTDKHVVTAQARFINEKITDGTGVVYSNPTNTLNSFFTKVSYVYNSTYGAGLGYQNVTGTSDMVAYGAVPTPASGSSASPNSTAWIPSIWWQPIQNIKLTLQYTAFTQFQGAKANYDGAGTNASANNVTWLSLWVVM